jgi:hypothetical protein
MIQVASRLRSLVDEDGAVILDSSSNQITTLDAMGGYIWRCLEQGMAENDITQHLIDETGESPEVIQKDLQELLTDLRSRRLLISSPNGEASL